MQDGLLIKGGGHAMAAGFKLDRRKENDVLAMLAERLAVSVAAATVSRPLAIDGALSSGAASVELMELLERFGPYGTGHPEPRFVFPAHRLCGCALSTTSMSAARSPRATARASKPPPSGSAIRRSPSSCLR